jgi:SOS response associated peptidase (SRAP)
MPLSARNSLSSVVITRSARSHSIRCAGSDPELVQRPAGWSQAHQRQVRDGAHAPYLSRRLSISSLHPSRGRLHEWMTVKGAKAKQPFAIAMKDGKPFGIGGIWENWRDPASGEWVRTFAVITTAANALVGQIHDRMPLILACEDYGRWLSDEPDAHELMKSVPAEAMRMWPVSTRVNKPENDDPKSSRSFRWKASGSASLEHRIVSSRKDPRHRPTAGPYEPMERAEKGWL